MEAHEAFYLISHAAQEHGREDKGWETIVEDLQEALRYTIEALDGEARAGVLRRLLFLWEAPTEEPDDFLPGDRVWWMDGDIPGDTTDSSAAATVAGVINRAVLLRTDAGEEVAADVDEIRRLAPVPEPGTDA